MDAVRTARPPTRRPALGDSTRRVNNTLQHGKHTGKEHHARGHHETTQRVSPTEHRNEYYYRGVRLPDPNYYPPPPPDYQPTKSPPPVGDPQPTSSAKQQALADDDSAKLSRREKREKRESKLKTHVGPWNLGLDLGKGATSRVRLARHAETGQLVAVKIVPKRTAKLNQAGSLASLDIREADLKAPPNTSRLPYSIEREVAIMKLIQHPHILQLIDIWENHNEIYLVLEYVDGGELFHYIGERGRLVESVAIRIFRQLLSAVGYCHKLRICHRDLKPENILLTKDEDAKIADFGMAALHQTSDHQLRTSCGSPHYAAPEIMQGNRYRGDRTDIWSMGVILYACLVGGLPFDARGNDSKEITRELARLVVRGEYFMPPQLSIHAQDLIQRILRVNPADRITISQMWRHPLIRQYDYLDDLNPCVSGPQSLELKAPDGPPLQREDIDDDILRHLKSMWHKFTEEEIINLLTDESTNDQKMFYHLLVRYRESQLENYGKNVINSPSDYHHIRPLKQVKKITTRQFQRPNTRGPTRSGSRFTVISNAAETVQSYDPYRAESRIPPAEYASVTVYRDNPTIQEDISMHDVSLSSTILSKGSSRQPTAASSSQRFMAARGYTTRSSISSNRSRNGTPVVKPNIGHKRPVNFSHIRRGSIATKESSCSHLQQALGEDVSDSPMQGAHELDRRYIRSKKERAALIDEAAKLGVEVSPALWNDVLKISTSLAKDCDEAFNPSPNPSDTRTSRAVTRVETPKSWRSRPLPPTPATSEAGRRDKRRQIPEMRKPSAAVSEPISQLHRVISHLDRRVRAAEADAADRRVVSAPPSNPNRIDTPPLDSIRESSDREAPNGSATIRPVGDHLQVKASRIGSEPLPARSIWSPAYPTDDEQSSTPRREVTVGEPTSPAKPPAPLNIRKKSSRSEFNSPATSGGYDATYTPQGASFRHDTGQAGLDRLDDPFVHKVAHGSLRDRRGWLRQSIKSEEEDNREVPAEDKRQEPKKRSSVLSKLFKRKGSKNEFQNMFNIYEDDNSLASFSSEEIHAMHARKMRHGATLRQIEPQQNWLARLFRIKPATKYICFAVSKTRARQEIACIFRQWRKFGMESVVVDKQRNMVFARVASRNMASIKPVAIAAEIMTVIEHGKKRQPLSIARFTQESGAASSFQRVMAQLFVTLKGRGMLVSDEWKAQMMIKTLGDRLY